MLPHNIKRFPIRGNAGADTACEATAQLTPHGAALVSDKNSPVGVPGDFDAVAVFIGNSPATRGNYCTPKRFIPGSGRDFIHYSIALIVDGHGFPGVPAYAGCVYGAPRQEQEKEYKVSHNEPPKKEYQYLIAI